MEKIEITTAGVKRSLNSYSDIDAIIEYIWNGFDANASEVHINFLFNELGGVEELRITDNGFGIDNEKLDNKFKPFFQSEKIAKQIQEKKRQNSTYHGKNGVGRLTFFKFADTATWNTCYEDNNKNKYKYEIKITADNLTDYAASKIQKTDNSIGTTVVFNNLITNIIPFQIEETISKEFCWFLFLKKDLHYKIFINGKQLDFSTLMHNQSKDSFNLNGKTFSYEYVNWNIPLTNEYSRYYFLNSKGNEVFKDYTTFNKKGDKFYHSLYVRSDFFDDFILNKNEINNEQINFWEQQNQTYKLVVETLDKIIYEKRKPYIKAYSRKVIEDLDEAKAFDFYNETNVADKFKSDNLKMFIQELFIIEPKLFSSLNKEQKVTFVRLLDTVAFSSDRNSIFKILESVLDMSSADTKALADLIELSPLTNITKAISLLVDRLKAIDYFEKAVYQENLNANEVRDLQRMLEENHWIFGEQYSIVAAAETNFVKLVENHLSILRKEDGSINEEIVAQIKSNPDKYKQVDLCLTRQLPHYDNIENIVVEIKHPLKTISTEHYNQLRKYMDTLTSVKEFTADNYKWTFFLLGAKLSNQVQDDLDNMKTKGKEHLIFEKYNFKIEIFVRTWKSIFNEYRIKYNNLYERLKIDENKIVSNPQNIQDLQKLQKELTT